MERLLVEPSTPIKNLCKNTEISLWGVYNTDELDEWADWRTEGLKENEGSRCGWRLHPSLAWQRHSAQSVALTFSPDRVWERKRWDRSLLHSHRHTVPGCPSYYHADPMDPPEQYKAPVQQSETQFHHSTGLKWPERWKAHCKYSDFTSGRSLLCNRLEIQAFEIDLLSVQQNESYWS